MVTIQLGLGSESIAHMDVGKERELGAEALRRKKVAFSTHIDAIARPW